MRQTLLSRIFLREILKRPKMAFLFLVMGGIYLLIGGCPSREDASFEGVPKAQSWHWSHIVCKKHFMLEYDEVRKNPLWVVYKIRTPDPDAPHLKRPSGFDPDTSTFARVDEADYTRSGYDRGHMAPNHAIATLYGKPAQKETFLMSNITPQRPNLNRKIWQRLEAAELDQLTTLGDEITVFTGPIFASDPQRLPSGVAIPEAFFKIYALRRGGEVHLLAFIVPQNVRSNAKISSYMSSVDAVESASGFDFFHALPDGVENTIEAQIDPFFWDVDSMDRIKNRTF